MQVMDDLSPCRLHESNLLKLVMECAKDSHALQLSKATRQQKSEHVTYNMQIFPSETQLRYA